MSLLSSLIFLNLKSTPIVDRKDSLKLLSTNLLSNDDFPTAESPTKTNLNYFEAVFNIYERNIPKKNYDFIDGL